MLGPLASTYKLPEFQRRYEVRFGSLGDAGKCNLSVCFPLSGHSNSQHQSRSSAKSGPLSLTGIVPALLVFVHTGHQNCNREESGIDGRVIKMTLVSNFSATDAPIDAIPPGSTTEPTNTNCWERLFPSQSLTHAFG